MLLTLGQRTLDLSVPRIMGVLNCTPDSFSDGGRYQTHDAALQHARQMVDEGADIIDVGGESTRPGAPEVELAEELDRVIPVVESLTRELDVPVSVDTSKPAVMVAATEAGASMLNDVTALQGEGAIDTAAQLHQEFGAAICLMHMQGTPRTMQNDPQYQNVVAEVLTFLVDRARLAEASGVAADGLVIDPGFGFGKTLEHNLKLLNGVSEFAESGYAILAGLSRKSMIEKILGETTDERLVGSVTLALLAVQRGANIVRVHDVRATADALNIVRAAGLMGENAATVHKTPK